MNPPRLNILGLRSCLVVVLAAGVGSLACCVGSPIHTSITYHRVKNTIDENNKNLLRLKVGMEQSAARAVMGDPERSEGYAWGTAWLYRTAFTTGATIYRTVDSDFTPVVFDEKGILIGWGRNFFVEQAKRYELKIKQE